MRKNSYRKSRRSYSSSNAKLQQVFPTAYRKELNVGGQKIPANFICGEWRAYVKFPDGFWLFASSSLGFLADEMKRCIARNSACQR